MPWTWQSSATIFYGQGEEIKRQAEDHNLPCLIIGGITHRVGSTLDLAWTNISGTSAKVEGKECVASDYLSMCRLALSRKQPIVRIKCYSRVNRDELGQYAHVVSR